MAKKIGRYIEISDTELAKKIHDTREVDMDIRKEDIQDAVNEIDLENIRDARLTEDQLKSQKEGVIQDTTRKKNRFIDEMKDGKISNCFPGFTFSIPITVPNWPKKLGSFLLIAAHEYSSLLSLGRTLQKVNLQSCTFFSGNRRLANGTENST